MVIVGLNGENKQTLWLQIILKIIYIERYIFSKKKN